MLLRDKELRQRLRFQARQLAGTGRYQNWQEVEHALTRAGRQGAPHALRAPLVRLTLDIRCALTRRRRTKQD